MREFFKKYWREIVLISLIGIIVLLILGWNKTSKESQRWEDNYNVAIDSVNIVKSKNGELIYERDLYKLNYNELNEEYQKKVKTLENQLNTQVKIISDLKTNIKVDTLIFTDSVYIKDDITYISFKYKDEWMNIVGETNLKDTTTVLNNLYIDVPLTVGIGNNYNNLFITSPNPYITISSIEGYSVENTPESFKHWTISGELNMMFQKNVLSNTLDIIPNLEVDIEYLFTNNVFIHGFGGVEFITNQMKNDIGCYVGCGVGYSFSF